VEKVIRDDKGRFVKGSPRPAGGGRQPLDEDMKGIKPVTKTTIRRHLSKFIHLEAHELAAIVEDKSNKVIDIWLARIVLKGINEGDQRRLDFMC